MNKKLSERVSDNLDWRHRDDRELGALLDEIAVFDAADPKFTTLATSEPTQAILYGPPRSIRGRLANRLRRLVGFDEQDEVYWVSVDNGTPLNVEWDARGIFRLRDDGQGRRPTTAITAGTNTRRATRFRAEVRSRCFAPSVVVALSSCDHGYSLLGWLPRRPFARVCPVAVVHPPVSRLAADPSR